MACEEKNALARRLMDAFQQRDHIAKQGSVMELMAVRTELAKRNALLSQHRRTCPLCPTAKGPILLPDLYQ